MLPRLSTVLRQSAFRRNIPSLRNTNLHYKSPLRPLNNSILTQNFVGRNFQVIGPFRSFSTEQTEQTTTQAASSNDLELLKTLAVGAPHNATVQYIYLKELNKTNPEAVVQYYKEGKFTSSEEVISYHFDQKNHVADHQIRSRKST